MIKLIYREEKGEREKEEEKLTIGSNFNLLGERNKKID